MGLKALYSMLLQWIFLTVYPSLIIVSLTRLIARHRQPLTSHMIELVEQHALLSIALQALCIEPIETKGPRRESSVSVMLRQSGRIHKTGHRSVAYC